MNTSIANATAFNVGTTDRVVRLPYGTAAALVFDQLFFPTVDPLTGALAAFGTYAGGFVVRPIGGVIFGHFGDRVGRKSMLVENG